LTIDKAKTANSTAKKLRMGYLPEIYKDNASRISHFVNNFSPAFRRIFDKLCSRERIDFEGS